MGGRVPNHPHPTSTAPAPQPGQQPQPPQPGLQPQPPQSNPQQQPPQPGRRRRRRAAKQTTTCVSKTGNGRGINCKGSSCCGKTKLGLFSWSNYKDAISDLQKIIANIRPDILYKSGEHIACIQTYPCFLVRHIFLLVLFFCAKFQH